MFTQGKSILLIEDDSSLSSLIQLGLKAAGYDLDAVVDGLAAREYLKKEQPDLILLDLYIPGMDGLQLLSWIREQDMKTPVVVLSASDTEKDSAMAYGANAFIAKPVQMHVLTSILARVLATSL